MSQTVNEGCEARSAHFALRGEERLSAVVSTLIRECPWTATVDGASMARWLRSECDEVTDALRKYARIRSDGSENSSPHGAVPVVELDARRSLVSELGDCLFDARLLAAVVARDLSIDSSAPASAAAEKIERRTPYIRRWGDGSVARTADDATRMWRAAKSRETEHAPPSSSRHALSWVSHALQSSWTSIAAAAAMGFVCGVYAARRTS